MKHFFIAAVALLATTISVNLKAQTVSDADSKAIKKTYEGIMAAFGRTDAAAVASYYTENGTHISPDGQITSGRAALKGFFEKLFAWFKAAPQPDKSENNQSNWNTRYLSSDLIMVTYTDEHTDHFGNKVEKDAMAVSVILKKTKDAWLCEQVAMTPVKSMQ